MNYEFIDYTYCEIDLNGYIITNIQKAGFPGPTSADDKGCGAHLESLTIESPVVGSTEVNKDNTSASGHINIIDYKDAVFDSLRNRLKKFLDENSNSKEAAKDYLSRVKITIKSFTNMFTLYGQIMDWQFNFVGMTPTLSIDFNVIDPSTDKVNPPPAYKTYSSPKELVKALREAYSPDIPIVYSNNMGSSLAGKDLDDNIVFIGSDGTFLYNSTSLPNTCGNSLIDSYFYLIKNCITKDGKYLSGHYNNETNKFEISYRNVNNNQPPKDSIVDELVFVQNGCFKPYQKRSEDGKIVIPMTSFNYEVNQTNLAMQFRVSHNPNGTTVVQNGGDNSTRTIEPNSGGNPGSDNGNGGQSTINVTFDCCNVTAFNLNDLNSKVLYEIYNERGIKSIVSGYGIVQKCSYTLSGGMIKASVTCCEHFNDSDVNESGSGSADKKSKEDVFDKLKKHADKMAGAKAVNKDEVPKTYEEYLRQEDDLPIPLSIDRTGSCLKNGTFGKHVDMFLDLYGDLKSTARRLDYSFIKTLYDAGDFGLLSLLYGPAHYGIKESTFPDYWPKNDDVKCPPRDPVLHDPGHKNSKEFCAGNIGKLPYHYNVGGLGIAHWDAGNLDDIYTTCGFDPSMTQSERDHIANLVVKSGKCTGWRVGSYKGVERIFPMFAKDSVMRAFDKGLKQDELWLGWAKNIVYYNGSNGRIYQHFLFEMWIRKMWLPTISELNKEKSSKDHIICLQDAIRISRAANSKTAWIYGNKNLRRMCGTNVSEQYDIYTSNGDKKHADKQKAYCKRLCKILEWEYSHQNSNTPGSTSGGSGSAR